MAVRIPAHAGVAQLVERDLAKVEVTSSNLATRSIFSVQSVEFGVKHSHLVTPNSQSSLFTPNSQL